MKNTPIRKTSFEAPRRGFWASLFDRADDETLLIEAAIRAREAEEHEPLVRCLLRTEKDRLAYCNRVNVPAVGDKMVVLAVTYLVVERTWREDDQRECELLLRVMCSSDERHDSFP